MSRDDRPHEDGPMRHGLTGMRNMEGVDRVIVGNQAKLIPSNRVIIY